MQRTILLSLLLLFLMVSCKLVDDNADNGVTEPTDYTMELTAPNGGESISEGSAYNVTWTSNAEQLVYIAFTYDNGNTWFMIADSIANTGVFEWFPVPNQISDQCKVKVTTVDQVASDISNANFSIVRNSNEAIVLTYPNGGNIIEAGSQLEIKWFSSGIDSVKLEYTLDNGSHWSLIDIDVNNTGVFYWEPVPDEASTLAKIRLMDATDNAPVDESDTVFTIVPQPMIQVIKPNGGETWTVGSSQRIEWYSENIRDVKIDYTTNNGADWFNITQETASIGFYTWDEIPSHNSQLCKVRVYDASDNQPSDVSDATFTITDPVVEESITIIEPNGGEEFEAGTVQNISWNANGIDSVKIELSTNNGAAWTTLVASQENTGGYQWSINRDFNAPQSLIRISDSEDGEPSDQSDGIFAIKPIKAIDVIYPTNGMVFNAGDAIQIQWTSSGIEKVGIRYTYTNGLPTLDYSGFEILETSIANEGYYETSFSIPTSEYYVEVFDAETGSPKSRSDGNFKITEQMFPTLELIYPNGGEEWLASTSNAADNDINNNHPYEIRWIGTDLEKVKIEWTTTGGGTWYTVPGADSTINDGSFTWSPGRFENTNGDPRPDSSDNCLLRISSVDDVVTDYSDAVFSIHSSRKIRIDVPNEGTERYFPPDDLLNPEASLNWPMVIQWSSYAVSTVDIYYSLNNGVTWEVVEQGEESTGAFAWDFVFGSNGPQETRISTQVRIKVVDATTGTVWDVNDVPCWLNIKEGG